MALILIWKMVQLYSHIRHLAGVQLKRFKHAIYNIIQELNEAEQESRNYDNNKQIENSVKNNFRSLK